MYRYFLCAALLALLSLSTAAAQYAPGYLGKRLTAGLGVQYSILMPRARPSFSLTGEYVLTNRRSLALDLSERALRAGRNEPDLRASELALVVMYRHYGPSVQAAAPPIGPNFHYGFGVARYRGDGGDEARDESRSFVTPLLSLGYGYGYVAAERYLVRPFARADLPLSGKALFPGGLYESIDRDLPELPWAHQLIFRMGVSLEVML